ncbi:MAG: transposase [Chloroflexota bacterium]
MARKARVQFAGATYHLMCRGNHQEAVFKDDRDCEIFLDTLAEVAIRNGWLIHAFVLMGNHYHLLLETPEPNLVDGMRWLQSTYTQRFNARHKVWGHLFQGRYKALLVDGGDYFQAVADYIHLNPARAHCFDLEKGMLADYKWSSYPGYLRPSKRPVFLSVDRVLGAFGQVDDRKGRVACREQMKKRVLEIQYSKNPKEADERWQKIRRGWVFGSTGFVEEMKDALDKTVLGKRRDSFMGSEVRHHDEKEAERLFQFGLDVCDLKNNELAMLKKSDPRKKVIAWFVRRQTSVRVEWISTRLEMGSRSNLAHYIRDVEISKKGNLWELKRKITNQAD